MNFFILTFCILFYKIKISYSYNNTTNETKGAGWKLNSKYRNMTKEELEKFKNLNLTNSEVDKFKACQELTNMIIKEDDDIINSAFTRYSDIYNNPLKLEARISMLFFTMIQKCYNKINDTLVNLIYHNLTRVVKLESIDDSEIDYIRINYTEFIKAETFELTLNFSRFIMLYRNALKIYEHAHMTPEEIKREREEEELLKKEEEEKKRRLLEMRLNRTMSKRNKTIINETENANFSKIYENNTFNKSDELLKDIKFNAENDDKKKKDDKKIGDL